MSVRRILLTMIAIVATAFGLCPGAAAAGSQRAIPFFTVGCTFSHRAPDDPMVDPDMPGMSHSHDFFGNTTTGAFSTLESLKAGSTTCRDTADKSAYWAPTAYDDGVPLQPIRATIYYRNVGADLSAVKVPPPGLRMIAGNMSGMMPLDPKLTGWACRRPDGSKTPWTTTVPTCASDQNLDFRVVFPECWNGQLDSPDHRSHLARILKDGTCPSTHPFLLPRISMEIPYDSQGGAGVTLASGSPVDGAHMDFFNAWRPAVLTDLVKQCLLSADDACGLVGSK